MKKINLFFKVVLITLVMSSCVAVKVGADVENERSKNSTSESKSTEAKLTLAKAVNTNTSSETGFYIGVAFTDISLSNDLELQPEINFIGIKNMNQVHVPVLVKYNIADKLNAYLGPNFGILLDPGQTLKSFNLGADLGLSYDINDYILIEARYDYGLTNLRENGDSNNSVKFSNFQVGVAYKFDKK